MSKVERSERVGRQAADIEQDILRGFADDGTQYSIELTEIDRMY